jgi:hypothetical protein
MMMTTGKDDSNGKDNNSKDDGNDGKDDNNDGGTGNSGGGGNSAGSGQAKVGCCSLPCVDCLALPYHRNHTDMFGNKFILSIWHVWTCRIEFILFVSIPGLFYVYSGLNPGLNCLGLFWQPPIGGKIKGVGYMTWEWIDLCLDSWMVVLIVLVQKQNCKSPQIVWPVSQMFWY